MPLIIVGLYQHLRVNGVGVGVTFAVPAADSVPDPKPKVESHYQLGVTKAPASSRRTTYT